MNINDNLLRLAEIGERDKAQLESAGSMQGEANMSPMQLYRLTLKKRRISRILRDAMERGGLSELIKKTKFKKGSLAEEY